jgi:hypothetical protein
MNLKATLNRKWGWWLAAAGMVILFLPVLMKITGVPFYQGAEYCDLLISHLPNAIFIQNALGEWGQIPLWNPTIYSGAPFAADPLSGMTYLPNWVAVAFPVPLTFNLLVLLHLCWSAVGCYFLARKSELGRTAGVIFGLAFAGTPKFFAHLGLGHISLIFAVSWTPWLLVCVASTLKTLSQDGMRSAVLTGGILGLIFLADPRWAIPSLLLASGYAVHRWLLLPANLRGKRVQFVKTVLLVSGFSIGIAALLALSLWEFLQLSTRATLSADASNILALDWGHLLGLFHPILAQAEQVTYMGVTVLILALVGLMSRKRGSAFWGGVFIVSILLSLGSATPLYPLFMDFLPGAGFLRVPARMLFLTAMAAAALAGYGTAWLLEIAEHQIKLERVRLGYLSLILLIALINISFAVMGIGTRSHQLLVVVLVGVAGVLLEIGSRGCIHSVNVGRLWMIVIIIELLWINASMIRMEPYDTVLAQPFTESEDFFHAYGEARIFSPSYAVSLLSAAQKKLELADGVNPLQLSAYYDYLQRATGFKHEGYRVTLPPFPGGDPKQAWITHLDQELLSRLNISHVVSDYALSDVNLIPVDSADDVYLYKIEDPRPRARVEKGESSWTRAEIMSWSPNRILVQADGPGLLVLSEVAYPGWQVEVDDQKVELETDHGLFRAVAIPEGEHHVVFSFRSVSVFLGSAIFGLTLLLGIILGWKR